MINECMNEELEMPFSVVEARDEMLLLNSSNVTSERDDDIVSHMFREVPPLHDSAKAVFVYGVCAHNHCL